jgi:hypothetical protein
VAQWEQVSVHDQAAACEEAKTAEIGFAEDLAKWVHAEMPERNAWMSSPARLNANAAGYVTRWLAKCIPADHVYPPTKGE